MNSASSHERYCFRFAFLAYFTNESFCMLFPNSASKAGLVSFFEFIVGANHKMLLGSGVGLEEGEEYDDIDFPMLLRDNLHKPVLLLVYNIKAREQREVQLIPKTL